MKTTIPIRYVPRSKMDEIRLPFPVSPHVIKISHPKKKPQSRILWREFFASLTVVVLCMTSIGVANARGTISYFNDNELSQGNQFRAGAVGFSVRSTGVGYTFEPHDYDGAFEVSVIIPDPESLQSNYSVHAEQTAGDTALCNALHASATTSPFIYDGSLMALATTTGPGTFQLEITLPDSSGLSDGNCSVDLIYRAWLGESPTAGYTDEHRVPLTFTFELPAPIAPASFSASEIPTDTVLSEVPPTDPAPADPPQSDPPITDPQPKEQTSDISTPPTDLLPSEPSVPDAPSTDSSNPPSDPAPIPQENTPASDVPPSTPDPAPLNDLTT